MKFVLIVPAGAAPSVGVQLTAEPSRTTTIRLAPLPFAQLIAIWAEPTSLKSRLVASVVGSAARVERSPAAGLFVR